MRMIFLVPLVFKQHFLQITLICTYFMILKRYKLMF